MLTSAYTRALLAAILQNCPGTQHCPLNLHTNGREQGVEGEGEGRGRGKGREVEEGEERVKHSSNRCTESSGFSHCSEGLETVK